MRTLLALKRIYQARYGRFLAAIPASTVLAVVGLLLTIVFAQGNQKTSWSPKTYWWLLGVTSGVGVVLIMTQGVMEYLRRKYDLTLALKIHG